MAAPILVKVSQFRPLLDMAAGTGVDVEALLAGLGLSQALIADQPDHEAPLSDYYRLQREISIAVEDETFHLSSRQLIPGTTDFVLSHLEGAASLFDAMKIVARHYNLLHGGEYNLVRRRGDVIRFVIDDRNFSYTQKDNPDYIRFSVECVMIFVHCMLATIAPKQTMAGLRGVAVTRRSGAGAGHLAFWTAPVKFGLPTYSFDYDARLAMERVALPPPERRTIDRVYDEVIRMVDVRGGRESALRDMTGLVRDSLRRGVVDQAAVAAVADVSIATLRRRLADEGTNFRDLRRDVLNGAAKELLKKKRPIADIADELGFSEFRSFNRAFKEWNGMTPRAFLDQINSDSRA